MKKLSQIGGIIGIALVALGGTVGVVQGDLSLIAMVHLVLGGALLITALVINVRQIKEFVSKGSVKMGPQILIQGVLLLILLLFVNVIIFRHDYIKDFTSKRLFTLRPQTKLTLKKLPGKVDVMAFFPSGSFSEARQRLQIYGNYPKVSFRHIDPDKNEDLARTENIPREPGVLFKYKGKRVWINKYNEQDITNALIKVTRETRPKVWFSTGHGEPSLESNAPNGLSSLSQMLTEQGYQAETVDLRTKEKIPPDVSMLALVGLDSHLTKNEIKILDKYLSRGGDAMILLDPVLEVGSVSGLEKFLAPYGVRAQWNLVRDRESRLAEDKTGLWLLAKDLNDKHPITEGLTQPSLVFYWTRSLTAKSVLPPRLSVKKLASSSPHSFAKYIDPSAYSEQSEEERSKALKKILNAEPRPEEKTKHVLAYAVKKKPPQRKAWLDEQETPSEMRMVVVGTSAICRNLSISMPYNWEFVINSFNWLAGEEDLKHIKSRQRGGTRIYLSRSQKNAILYVSVMIIPEVFMIIGLAVWWRRR
ncbi:MAG: Gldg family protein [bacterium]